MLTIKDRENEGKIYFTDDLMSKVSAWESLCAEDSKMVAEMFSIDEKKYLEHQTGVLSETFLFFNKLYVYSKNKKSREAENILLEKKIEEVEKTYVRKKFTRGEIVSFPIPASENLTRNLEARASYSLRVVHEIELGMASRMNNYIRKLVDCFPKQGKKIQGYVKKAQLPVLEESARIQNFNKKNPYPEGVELALLLERAIGRNKEMMWVFSGLPSSEKAWKIEVERTKKFNEESRKLTEETKRLSGQKAEAPKQ
jgi:hypothetical protein